MLQGPGIVDIEDMDQDFYSKWKKLDLMGMDLLDAVPTAPPGVILAYSLDTKWLRNNFSFDFTDEDNNNVSN